MKISFYKYFLLLSALLPFSSAFSQSADTIVVYEYIYKTDTVWLEPKPTRDTLVIEKLESIEEANLLIDTTSNKASLQFFSYGASATIPINRIIYNGNQNHSNMKRKGLFTMLLLSLQAFSYGQAEMSVYTGTTSHWIQHNASTVSNPMWIGAHTGIELSLPLKNEKWSIASGFELYFIFPTADYYQTKAINNGLPYIERDFAQIQTNSIINELNTGLFNAPFKQICFPLKLSRQFGKWKPYVGMSGSHSFFVSQLPYYDFDYDDYYQYYQNHPKPQTQFFDVAILAGTRYSFSKKIGLKIEMSQGLTGRHNEFEYRIKPNAGVDEYYFKSCHLNMSLVFTL